MSKLFSTTEFQEVLKTCASQEREEIFVATAFLKLGAIEWLHSCSHADCSIRLVAQLSPRHFVEGSSDIDAVKYCLDNDIEISLRNDLHSKVYSFSSLNRCFVGSANLTRRGLALTAVSNHETTGSHDTKIDRGDEQKLLFGAVPITNDLLATMIAQLNDMMHLEPDQLEPWSFVPEQGRQKEFFSSEFPDVPPAEVEKSLSAFLPGDLQSAASSYFCNSKVHRWVVDLVTEKEDEYTNFGWLTSKIHAALLDDPVPYRSGVKEICGLLFEWIEAFSDELEIDQHARTKSLRLKNI